MPAICHGCGQRVAVPPGYRRRKLQCSCGVIVELAEADLAEAASAPPPAAAPAWAGSRAEPDVEERWAAELLGSSEPAPPVEEPEPAVPEEVPGLLPQEPRAERQRDREVVITCRRCGRRVQRQRECPVCDAAEAPPLPSPPADDDEEDGSPYDIHGGADVPCPECTNHLPPGSKFCTRCGYDFRRRKKRIKTYQPLKASWDSTMSLKRRLGLWGILQVLSIAGTMIFNRFVSMDLAGFALSFLGFAAMTAFLLGTFDRIDMERDTRGRVKLLRIRRLFFFIAAVQPIDVVGYEGVATGRSNEVTGWEWLVFFFLLVSGVLPGLVWWYLVIHKITFHVDLTRDHGYPEVMVYRGWSEEQMRDIARTISEASGLRCEGV